MVYISNWQEFQQAAEGLYEQSPRRTRYCVKWRGTEGVLVLKITDNSTCLKYKTRSSIFLNRFEALNMSLIRKMQNKKVAPTSSFEGPQAGTIDGVAQAPAGVGQAGSSITPTTGGPTGAGVKKKKGKKKK